MREKGPLFARAGLPVPVGSSQKDLARIDALLQRTGAGRLVILGDFLHAKSSRQPETLTTIQRWRESHQDVRIMLVRGNHDRCAGRVPSEWRFDEVEEPFDEGCGVLFSHEPRDADGVPVLCGHVHPVVSVMDFDRSAVRVPCFCFDERGCGILPAFGSLTGGHNVGMRQGQRVYLATGSRVIAAERVQKILV